MGIVTPPTEKTAKSACTPSARLAERMPIASPFFRPRASRPAASSRTLWPTSFHVVVVQVPPRLACWAGRSPLRSTRFQNIFARVSWVMGPSSRQCAELFSQDLADRTLGQRADEAHVLGALVPGQPPLAERHDLGRGGGHTVAEHDEGEHVLAHQGVG